MKQIAMQRVFYDSEKDAFWKEGKCNPPYYLALGPCSTQPSRKNKDDFFCVENGPLYFRRKENGKSYVGIKYDTQWVCTGCLSNEDSDAGGQPHKFFKKKDLE